jgi:hypothetical protein
MPSRLFRFFLFFLLTLPGCVPISQQTISNPTVDCNPLIVNKEQFDETVMILRDKIHEYKANSGWRGPCRENPLFRQRFQSDYTVTSKAGFRIENHCILFRISGGGAYGDCLRETLLIWNGELIRDKKGRLIASLVISHKNKDIRKSIFHDSLAFDLTSMKAETGEDIYLDILGYSFSELIRYEPR